MHGLPAPPPPFPQAPSCLAHLSPRTCLRPAPPQFTLLHVPPNTPPFRDRAVGGRQQGAAAAAARGARGVDVVAVDADVADGAPGPGARPAAGRAPRWAGK
eukprot:30968-Chlamydomonas_euryale.AAC.1